MATKYTWKVCLVGDTGVGKTCVAVRFHQDRFTGTIPTIGYAFMEKTLQVDEIEHQFNVWDTAGQERYRSLARGFFRRASAMVLVYDITNSHSFQVLDKYWVRSAQRGAPENAALAVIGNKSDIDDDKRQVTEEEGSTFAQKHNAIFMEVSAKTGKNVNEFFEELARALTKTPELEFQAVGMRILNTSGQDSEASTDEKTSKNRCCSSSS
ncbi:ras-related protein Rab-22A-like [Acanthaster planci]|uniref:Ras-related protein Rab-22A-like n=1 Tax=Acanthaster planci TaxID=133434 RepID=A0A8B7YFL0_ACAPL|nr:ras-related protein Rab-22A-like [Acanthaster planci]